MIISTRSPSTETANYLGTKLVEWRSSKRENKKFTVVCSRSPNKPRMWSFHVIILQRTAKKCTKMQKARAERLFLLIKPIFLWRCRCRCRRRCLSSLMVPTVNLKTCYRPLSLSRCSWQRRQNLIFLRGFFIPTTSFAG